MNSDQHEPRPTNTERIWRLVRDGGYRSFPAGQSGVSTRLSTRRYTRCHEAFEAVQGQRSSCECDRTQELTRRNDLTFRRATVVGPDGPTTGLPRTRAALRCNNVQSDVAQSLVREDALDARNVDAVLIATSDVGTRRETVESSLLLFGRESFGPSLISWKMKPYDTTDSDSLTKKGRLTS